MSRLTCAAVRQLRAMIMNPKKLLTLFTLAACSILHAAPVGEELDKEVAAATLVQKDRAAPDFTCQTTDGRNITLSALKGKVVVLYFFSTASVKASTAEMRYLEKEIFQKLRKRDDFQMLAIGRNHTREELVQLGGENKLAFPLAADPKQEIYARYFTKFVPRTVVVRRDGSIAYHASGYNYDGVLKLQAVLAHELAAQAP